MNSLILQLITGSLIGIGAGYVGSFMVLKRMSLVGDALSHVALPGIAIALLFNADPFIGAFTALLLAILGIWFLEKKTELPSETLVGIFFTLSLAIGLLITPRPELFEALFGDISKINLHETLITSILVFVVLIMVIGHSKNLILSTISKDLTRSLGINIDKTNLLFLLMVSVVVALGLRIAGTLLMGSLVIIPAAASRNISFNLSRYTLLSGLIGAASAIIGILVAYNFDLSSGPIIVLTSGFFFLLTLLFKG